MVQSDQASCYLSLFAFLGIIVLNNKTELEKVLDKQRKASEQKSGKAEEEVEDEFHRLLSEGAKRLEQVGMFLVLN